MAAQTTLVAATNAYKQGNLSGANKTERRVTAFRLDLEKGERLGNDLAPAEQEASRTK